MIKRTLTVVVMFVLFLSAGKVSAQCDCIVSVGEAVSAVMNYTDDSGWAAPLGLEIQYEKLLKSCSSIPVGKGKSIVDPLTKVDYYADAIREIVACIYYEKEVYDPLTGLWTTVPTPAEAQVLLDILLETLECSAE